MILCQLRRAFSTLGVWMAMALPSVAVGQAPLEGSEGLIARERALAEVFSSGKWESIDQSIDRALVWLATQQRPDGSFAAIAAAQPAVTSLGVMAFMARGHVPEEGRFGEVLARAIEFVAESQRSDGLLSRESPGREHRDKAPSHGASYNHAIAGLMLCEAYGMTLSGRARKIESVINKALAYTRELQTRPKSYPQDIGGWRYVHLRWSKTSTDSDLSVTGWQLMFLRAAKNAEFEVPEIFIDDAMGFVDRCWDSREGVFKYSQIGADNKTSRGVIGVGILCQSMAGRHKTDMAQRAGDWLLRHPFRSFGEGIGSGDRFFYSAYYCSQAVAQLGGHYWERFFPDLVNVLLASQTQTGAWPPEPRRGDAVFGNAYTTALAVLALTPAHQMLPVYQR